MIQITRRIGASTALLICTSIAAVAAHAQSASFTTPHVTTATGAESVQLGGVTFTNQGLVGVGRLAASTRDFAGETLGSFSGMALDLGSWHRNADGSYGGRMFTLPDRGPNDVGPFVGTTDYRNRVHTSDITLRPYTGAVSLPQATNSQNQLTITPTGGFLLTDATGASFTGKDAGSNVITRGGILYPSPASGEGAGRISLDSEAIAYRADGSFYVSDEYAANIYYFNAAGRQLGAINTVGAILPRVNGSITFDGANTPQTGRRNNQGLEALAITPDGSRLVTILQSATVQDTNGSNQQTRNNTRILVYNISSTATPTTPLAEYVLQLPIFTQNGSGAAPNRTAAQSEMLALNNNQFLVLSRDGIGRGSGASATNSPVFKSILLVDTTGGTNIAGTAFETGVTPIAANGALVPGIVPVQQVELVNMLNPVQLNRFGMNLATAPSTATSISEKFEALGLAPVLEESAPQDFFLLVGNDNDFVTANGFINGQSYNAGLSGAGGSGDNDSVILVYRLTLPTYVDPLALAALQETAPGVFIAARSVAAEIGLAASAPAINALSSLRRISGQGYGPGARIWIDGRWTRIATAIPASSNLDADGVGMAGGVDFGFGNARLGVSIGHQEIEGNFGSGIRVGARGSSIGVYGGLALPSGFYAQAAFSKALDLKVTRLSRRAAYQLTARGATEGDSWSAVGEVGWLANFGEFHLGPYAAVEYVDASIDGYVERGAALGNIAYSDLDFRRLRTTLGIEARTELSAAIRPSFRAGYSFEDERGDREGTATLASAQHSLATQAVALPSTDRNRFSIAGGIDGGMGNLTFSFRSESRIGRGEDEARISLGIGASF